MVVREQQAQMDKCAALLAAESMILRTQPKGSIRRIMGTVA